MLVRRAQGSSRRSNWRSLVVPSPGHLDTGPGSVGAVKQPAVLMVVPEGSCRTGHFGLKRRMRITRHTPLPLDPSGTFAPDDHSGHALEGDVNSESPKTLGYLVLHGRVHGHEESRCSSTAAPRMHPRNGARNGHLAHHTIPPGRHSPR